MADQHISFGVAGAGTAGLVAALMLREAFPRSEVTIIASSDIGIIGVGEGSTEHWREFMHRCNIPVHELIAHTKATHKYGLLFENWSSEFPEYFHSVSGDEDVYAWNIYGLYSHLIHKGEELTRVTGSIGLERDQIRREKLHENTNQFHFDTHALNRYLSKLAVTRNIKFVDATISNVNLNPENGNIVSVSTDKSTDIEADMWIDATGFKRVLMTALGETEWNSFSDYLLTDSAIAFPTESDPSGKIKTYTRARALTAGWAWEIPTQERRGNGYVYSSKHITEEQAIEEMETLLGVELSKTRSFSFDPGHLTKPWVKNCCAMGLSSSFIEPLEATSIGSTIQSLRLFIPFAASFRPHHTASQKSFNKSFNIMMDNLLTMIRLHYMTDRADTQFWVDAANAKINDSLQELLDLWQETTLSRDYIAGSHGEMFRIAHLLHVAQGQNVINREPIADMIRNFDIGQWISKAESEARHARISHELVDHAEALNEVFQ